MRYYLTLLGLLLGFPALAQPTCPVGTPTGAIQCLPQAVAPLATDVVSGVQQTGPTRSNQTVQVSLSQIVNSGFVGSFSTLAASGAASLLGGGTLTGAFTVNGPVSGSGAFSVPISLSTITATGSTTARTAADWMGDVINVKAGWGSNPVAKGDWVSVTGCDITISTTALTCSGATFTSADVGKTIIVRTAGTAAASLQTTISARVSGTQVTLADAAIATASAVRSYYGSDDTAAITAAINYGSAHNKCVYIPSGAYGLVSQSNFIVLNSTCIVGDFNRADRSPYIDKGTVLLVFNSSTATFNLALDNSLQNLSFFWPMQDGSQATPLVYPPLFDAPDTVYRGARWSMRNMMFVNPYVLIHTGATNNGFGAWTFSDISSYCIESCQTYLSGSTAFVAMTNWVNSPVFYPTEAALGSNLQAWTNANGNFMEMDVNGGTVKNVTGYYAANLQLYGVAAGFKLTSGRFSAVNLANFTIDGSRSVFTSANAAEMHNASWNGGYVWCQDSNDITIAPGCLSGNSTGAGIDLTISGVTFAAAAGDYLQDVSGTSFGTVEITGSSFVNFPITTTAATHYVINLANASANLVFVGNNIACAPVSGTAYGVRITAMLSSTVNNNQFKSCQEAFIAAPASGSRWSLKGNVVRLSAATQSWSLTNTTVANVVIDSDSEWDKSWPSTIGSGFGTSPSIACVRNWYTCQITVGTTSAATGVVTFPFTQAAAPTCQVNDQTTAVALKATSTTTQVTIAGAFADGDVLNLNCAR